MEALVKGLDAFGWILPVIKQGITLEIQKTNQPNTLFRANTIITKLMTQFTKLLGAQYLHQTLSAHVNQILREPQGYEVDTTKIQAGEDVQANMQKLQQSSQLFLDSIISTLDACPLPFREMAFHLQTEAIKKFPESRHTAVGGFIFLRFFCPAILSPESCGLSSGTIPSVENRRPLMLISKTLQNLASGVSFKTNMELMNSFMENNTAALDQFFSQITVVPPEYVYTPTYTLDEVNKHDLPFIHKSILQKLDPIAKNLMTHNQQVFTLLKPLISME